MAPGRLAVTPIGGPGHIGFIHEHGTQFIALEHSAFVFYGTIPAFVGVVPSLLHELKEFGVGYLAFGDVKGTIFHVVEVVETWEAQPRFGTDFPNDFSGSFSRTHRRKDELVASFKDVIRVCPRRVFLVALLELQLKVGVGQTDLLDG